MASLSFHDSDIRKINPRMIPSVFLMWYQVQSEARKEEIRRINPRLVAAIDGNVLPEDDSPPAHATASKPFPEVPIPVSRDTSPRIPESPADAGATNTEDEEIDPVQDEWESVPLRSWREKNVYVPVLVCKLMPEGNRVCRFHKPRVPLEERYLKFKTPDGKLLGAHGYYCPECLDFYMEQDEFEETIPGIAEAGIAGRIQPLSVTLDEWRRDGFPNIWVKEKPVYYITSAWNEQRAICPVHQEVLHPDDYCLRYKDREVVFQAFFCASCGKLMMGKARAGQLEEECGKKGVPCPGLYPLRKERKKKSAAVPQNMVLPNEMVADGHKHPYQKTTRWNTLGEDDTIVITEDGVCQDLDHEDQWEDDWRVVRVMEKKGGRKGVLVLLRYCGECEQFYVSAENMKALLDDGRPEVKLLDETDSTDWITSGEIFQAENIHLLNMENRLDAEIKKIQGNVNYTGQYEVNRYGYDDGNLAYGKHQSRSDREQIKKLDSWKPKPFVYRVDLSLDAETRTFYLGASEIRLDDQEQVMNFNTSLGRTLVNYRTELVRLPDGKEYHLKLRRRFDIETARLFGFMDEWDDSSAFFGEIRDDFLRKVLRMRHRHHQLLDILSTIQEKQNAIIDLPLNRNLVVQGCAGSGKTMVMLHRLAALQASSAVFRPETTLILTPSKYFNLHIEGLAENLQIQYIARYSVERYYTTVLESYDLSFRVIGEVADEMEVKDQAWIDTLYSDRFFNALIEETDAWMRELQADLQDKLPVSFEVPESAAGAQLLNILRDAVNRSARDVEAKETAFQQWAQECRRMEKRYSELDAKLPKLEADVRRTAMEEVSRARNCLETGIADAKRRMQELSVEISSDEDEEQRLEKTLFAENKTRKLKALRERITASQEELRECQRRLEKLAAMPDFMSVSLEELPGQLEEASACLPELRIHGQVIAQQMKQERDNRREWETVEAQLERARRELERTVTERYGDEERGNVEKLKKQFGGMTIKSLYERTLKMAAKREKIAIPPHTRTHRYDLYLQLRFALHYFGTPQKRYNLICVDEGQDLAESEYCLIRDLNGGSAVFNIFGDTRQLLKSGRGIDDWSKVSMVIPKPEIHTLNENYRNTNQITEHCNETFHMQMIKTGVDGVNVKQIYRGELETTLSNLRAEGERVAVILPRSVRKDSYLNMDTLSPDVRSIIGEDTGPGKITLVYVDEVKGVEFDRVFVILNSMSENERYIACTRALSHLTLVNDFSLEEPDDDLDSDDYLDSPDAHVVEEKNVPGPNRKSRDKRRTLPVDSKIDYAKVRKRPNILNDKKVGT